MMQMYKVFTNKKIIVFTDHIPSDYLSSDYLCINEATYLNSLPDLDDLQELTAYETIILSASNPEMLKRRLLQKYYLVIAAGGIVTNKKGELLVIFRRGVWDLPKGKVDGDESPSQAAIREVHEETCIRACIPSDTPLKTSHIYTEADHYWIKETTWYLMHSEEEREPKPQIEEDITIAKWASRSEVENHILQSTYPMIRELIQSNYLTNPGK
jgi:8-oxo-(d)GTP phosphatase